MNGSMNESGDEDEREYEERIFNLAIGMEKQCV